MIRAAFALLALTLAAPSLPQEGRTLSDVEKAACAAKGGHVGLQGKVRAETCHLPTTDAGKSCTTLGQCQSALCEVDARTLSPEQLDGKAPVTGQCPDWTGYWDGCKDIVMDGRFNTRCAH